MTCDYCVSTTSLRVRVDRLGRAVEVVCRRCRREQEAMAARQKLALVEPRA